MTSYLIPRYRNSLKLYGWRVFITTNLFVLLFVIFQKQMRWWAIIFRKAHSTLLARPRFQSERKRSHKGKNGI
jgi:hypothetical protein